MLTDYWHSFCAEIGPIMELWANTFVPHFGPRRDGRPTRSSSPLVIDRPPPELSFCRQLYCLPTSRFKMTKLEIESLKIPRHRETLLHRAPHYRHYFNPGGVQGGSACLKSNFRFLYRDCIIEWPSYSSVSVCISSVLPRGRQAALLAANPLPVSGWRRGKRW